MHDGQTIAGNCCARSAASADDFVRLTPHRELSLEHALEFIAADECVEVTPKNIRLRKVWLDPQDRIRHAKRQASSDQ